MKKLYISGKITGIEETAYELFEKAEKEVQFLGCLWVNPMKLNHNHDKSWLAFMRKDLKALLDCDGVYMLSNWETSRGAIVEHDLAQMLGLEIYYQS